MKQAAPDCPHCGYHGWTCVEKFPWIPPPLQRAMDVDGRLSATERAQIDQAAEPLEQALPQVRVHVCLGHLHADTDPREFGFWLLNASVPPDSEAASHRSWSILLVIDRSSRRASLTVGYGLDPYVSDAVLTDCLKAAAGDFAKGRYGRGAAVCIRKLHKALNQMRRAATTTVFKFRRSLANGTAPPEIMRDYRQLTQRSTP